MEREEIRSRCEAAIPDGGKIFFDPKDILSIITALEQEKMAVIERCISVLRGKCLEPDRHKDLSFDAFIAAGGNECPICSKSALESSQREAERLASVNAQMWLALTDALKYLKDDEILDPDYIGKGLHVIDIIEKALARTEKAAEKSDQEGAG